MPIVITRREEIKAYIRAQKLSKNKIGFVPTMGALHQGHAQLIKQCVAENEVSIVSIFVNPIQFGANEDLSKYPRPFQKDCDVCESHGVQVIFAPTVDEMYPKGFSTQISVPRLSSFMCGQFRPGHFEGVATVVMLLLNIMQADSVYFGQKDFQQVQVIKQMCFDLACNTKIHMVPTIREEDGLALSSRNIYLSPEARNIAKTIPQALASGAKLYLSGERSSEKILAAAQQLLNTKNLTPQYLELRAAADISKQITNTIEEECVLAISQIISSQEINVRLIDNALLSDDSTWVQVLEELIACTNS
ncbi:MAG: pantoate--beta-alanine ligase [Bdellovibrionota bacterium]